MARTKNQGPSTTVAVAGVKTPKFGGTPDDVFSMPIAWHLGKMDKKGRWRFNLNIFQGIHAFLLPYEGMSCHEIFSTRTKRAGHCHAMPIDAICEDARKRLSKIRVNTDTLYQIVVRGRQRLWGVMHHNIFCILWYDPYHEVYPMNITDN